MATPTQLASSNLRLTSLQQTLGGPTNPIRLSNYYGTRVRGAAKKALKQPLSMGTFKGLILAYPLTARQLGSFNCLNFITCAADSQGNLYVTGDYTSATSVQIINLDGTNATWSDGSNMMLPASATSSDIFLFKYQPDGKCLSAANILPGNGSNGDVAWTIAIDDFDNIFIGGQYHQTSTPLTVRNTNGTNSSMTLPTSKQGSDAFLLIYNSLGTCISGGQILSGLGTDKINSIAIEGTTAASNFDINSSYIYCAGSYQSSNPVQVRNIASAGQATTTSSIILPPVTAADGFIIKYNIGTGAVVAAGNLFSSNAGGSEIKEIIFKRYGDLNTPVIYCTGRYVNAAASITINNFTSTGSAATSGSTQVTIPGSSSSTRDDVFILKYQPSGICSGATAIVTGGASDSGMALAIDYNGNAYCVGKYTSTASVNISNLKNASFQTASTINLGASSGNSGTDIFMLKFDSGGYIKKAANIIRGNAGPNIQTPFSIYIDDVQGYIYVAGTFLNSSNTVVKDLTTIGADASLNNITLASNNSLDAFIVKYTLSNDVCVSACNPISGTGTDTIYKIVPVVNNLYFVGRSVSTTPPVIKDLTNTILTITPPLLASGNSSYPMMLRF